MPDNPNYAEIERYGRIKAMKESESAKVFGKIITPTVPNFVNVSFDGSSDRVRISVANLTTEQKDHLAAEWRKDLDGVKVMSLNEPVFRG